MSNKELSVKIGQKVVVTQKRSAAGRSAKYKATLQAIGLGSIGKTRTVTVDAATWGQIKRVSSIVEVTPA
jgi:ribosomal protein L30